VPPPPSRPLSCGGVGVVPPLSSPHAATVMPAANKNAAALQRTFEELCSKR
jgi:hypothetical protein